jgi:hypothetical protein
VPVAQVSTHSIGGQLDDTSNYEPERLERSLVVLLLEVVSVICSAAIRRLLSEPPLVVEVLLLTLAADTGDKVISRLRDQKI